MENNTLQLLSENFRKILREEINAMFNERFENGIPFQKVTPDIPIPTSINNSKLGWPKSEEILIVLFNLLSAYTFISCDLEVFKSHFIGKGHILECIQWHTNANRLVYLFAQLMETGFIQEFTNHHVILSNHFIDKNGKRFNPKTLRSLLNQARTSRMKEIDAIINALEKLTTK